MMSARDRNINSANTTARNAPIGEEFRQRPAQLNTKGGHHAVLRAQDSDNPRSVHKAVCHGYAAGESIEFGTAKLPMNPAKLWK
jgi:hypothetical protein